MNPDTDVERVHFWGSGDKREPNARHVHLDFKGKLRALRDPLQDRAPEIGCTGWTVRLPAPVPDPSLPKLIPAGGQTPGQRCEYYSIASTKEREDLFLSGGQTPGQLFEYYSITSTKERERICFLSGGQTPGCAHYSIGSESDKPKPPSTGRKDPPPPPSRPALPPFRDPNEKRWWHLQ